MNTIDTINDNIISYFSINWLSETDGPGQRLVLFLQGCQLNCAWCHSPHSKPEESPLLYFESLCKKCQICKTICKKGVHYFFNNNHFLKREKCTRCGACIESCPQSTIYKQTGALILPTRRSNVSSLFETIRPTLEMLKNHGGITFSGGEPLLQSKALALLAKKCKESGFHTAVETSGIIPIQNIRRVYPFINTWLIGLRLVNGLNTTQSHFFEKRTRETLDFLKRNPRTEIIVRIPVIPDFTTTKSYLSNVCKLIHEYQIEKIELLPHNPESSHYYKAMNLPTDIEYNSIIAENEFKYVSDFLVQKIT